MTAAEFAEFGTRRPPVKNTPAPVKPDSSKTTAADKVAFVKQRIIKLKPKKRDGLVHSISAMFQFTGGITESETANVIANLQKQGFIKIGLDDKVQYRAA